MAALARIENPDKYGPDKLACGGCHIATYVAEATRATYGLDVAANPDAFTSTHDLSRRGDAAINRTSLRMFGYFAARPMIGDRVIHETAATVDDLETRFPLKK